MVQEQRGSQEKFDIEMSRPQEVIRPISAHKPRKVDGPKTKVLSNQTDIHSAIFDAA